MFVVDRLKASLYTCDICSLSVTCDQEIMKVKGYQGERSLFLFLIGFLMSGLVAPAELEGCLLLHADVSDTCVVGVPDDYKGEVPLAFVVLTPQAAERAAMDARAAYEIKASIMKVSTGHSCFPL
jgi:hypothetical protein